MAPQCGRLLPAPQVSASVHTESESARVRDRMLIHELPIKESWR
jgi:hypothetical protein